MEDLPTYHHPTCSFEQQLILKQYWLSSKARLKLSCTSRTGTEASASLYVKRLEGKVQPAAPFQPPMENREMYHPNSHNPWVEPDTSLLNGQPYD